MFFLFNVSIHTKMDWAPAPGVGENRVGEGRLRKPHRRGRCPGEKTVRRLLGQGALLVLRGHGGPGGLGEASGVRPEVWEGRRDGVRREGPRQGLGGLGVGARASGSPLVEGQRSGRVRGMGTGATARGRHSGGLGVGGRGGSRLWALSCRRLLPFLWLCGDVDRVSSRD